jgi:hypothetical protein
MAEERAVGVIGDRQLGRGFGGGHARNFQDSP